MNETNQPMSADQIAQLRQMTGESSRGQLEQRPVIKFSAKGSEKSRAGHFYLCEKDATTGEMKYTDLGTEIKTTILKIAKAADNGDGEPRAWIRETDSLEGTVQLEVEGEPEPKRGTYLDLKANYDLKYMEVLYLYSKNTQQVVKMKVRGMSLQPLWDYLKSIPNNDSVLRWITSIASVPQPTKYGSMQVLTFSKVEPVAELQDIVKLVTQLPRRASVALPAGQASDDTIEAAVEDINW